MSFLHYNSITNHYNKKEIDFFLSENEGFVKAQFIVQHKYDGSNFQIIFSKESTSPQKEAENDDEEKAPFKPLQFGSRNCLLGGNENFNNHKNIVKKEPYKSMIENVQKYLNETPDVNTIHLYGEIYGKVIKRINYYKPEEDQENKLVFFDVMFNEKYKSSKFFIEWAEKMKIPVVENYLIGTYEQCLAVDVTQYKTVAGDQIEGVVIKPYDHENDNVQPFYLKKKAEGFEEIVVVKQAKKTKEKTENNKPKFANLKCTDEQKVDLEQLENYLNPNRVKSAFSKKAWNKAETSALATEVLVDAMKDFKIDNEISTIDLELAKKAYMPEIFKLIKQENLF